MAGSGSASAGEVLELVRSGQARTRADLQRLTGLSRSTLSLRMAQLIDAGYVRESGQLSGSTGRPAKLLSFDETRQVVLAADLGAAHAHLAVVDGGGQVLMETKSGLKIDAGPGEVLRYVTRRLTELLAQSGRDLADVAGIGIGIPGPVRFDVQRPNQPPLMPGWNDYPVGEHFRQALGIPAFLDNDANLMGLGEARTHFAGYPSVLFVKVGTGIGAGVILRGSPERGVAGGAGDIGHIRVVHGGAGRRCTCGATGCLATVASGGALVRDLTDGGVEVSSPADVVRLVSEGHPDAIASVRRAGELLGDVLATSVSLLNPGVLVLGGGLSSAGPEFIDSVRKAVLERIVPLAARDLIIVGSSLGSGAAIQGARHLVIDQTFAPDAVDARLLPITDH